MISGLVPFEEIIEAIKDETGIENLRPLYDKLRRLIFRAEREIGYGGSVVLKKHVFRNPDNFNGKYFPFPTDFIELEGVGQDCHPIDTYSYQKTSDGIRFKTTQQKDVVLLYWGLYCDGYGNPVTTRNHQEAVIAYIIWKLYSQKIFLGEGNMNAAINYEQQFTFALLEARGDDAFPTMEEWNEIGFLSYQDRRALIMHPIASYNYCSEAILTECTEDNNSTNPEDIMKVFYWQLENITQTIENVIPQLTDNIYLSSKAFTTFADFHLGKIIDYTNIAKIAFAVAQTEDVSYTLTDVMNNDVTDEFDVYYAPIIKAKVYISKNNYTYSSIFFKIKIT